MWSATLFLGLFTYIFTECDIELGTIHKAYIQKGSSAYKKTCFKRKPFDF